MGQNKSSLSVSKLEILVQSCGLKETSGVNAAIIVLETEFATLRETVTVTVDSAAKSVTKKGLEEVRTQTRQYIMVSTNCSTQVALTVRRTYTKFLISVVDQGTVMFSSIFAVLFALIIAAALIAKFHFKKNLTDIFFYQ